MSVLCLFIAYTHHLSILLTPTSTHFLSFDIPFIHRPFSFFSTNTTHHNTKHHTQHFIPLHSSPHSSTASPNSSITVITVILRFSRSNARLPASLTIPEVAGAGAEESRGGGKQAGGGRICGGSGPEPTIKGRCGGIADEEFDSGSECYVE